MLSFLPAVSLTSKAFKRAVVLKGLKWVNRTKKRSQTIWTIETITVAGTPNWISS